VQAQQTTQWALLALVGRTERENQAFEQVQAFRQCRPSWVMSRRWTIASTSILTTTWRTTTGDRVWTRVDEAPGHEECPPKIVWPRISLDEMDLVENKGKSSKHHDQVRCRDNSWGEEDRASPPSLAFVNIWRRRLCPCGTQVVNYIVHCKKTTSLVFYAKNKGQPSGSTIYSACCNLSSLKQGFDETYLRVVAWILCLWNKAKLILVIMSHNAHWFGINSFPKEIQLI